MFYSLTNGKRIQLKISMSDFDGNSTSFLINRFMISDEQSGYAISYANYNSRMGHSLPPRNTKFSTIDRDNDAWTNSCAVRFSGAWWYTACHNSNLNGLYLKGKHESFGDGVSWFHFRGYQYSLKDTELKIRERA
jgi:ficolin